DSIQCDQLNSQVWRAAFWRWSIITLTPIALVDGVQDYAIADSSFFRLFRGRLTRTDVTPNEDDEKDVVEYLSPSKNIYGSMYSVRAISSISTTTIRLDAAASVPTGVTMFINGDFQIEPVKITTTSVTVVFPDDY